MKPLLYNLRDGTFRCGRRILRIGIMEEELLFLLLSGSGRFISRDDLIYGLWIGRDREEPDYARGCLDALVANLQRKLACTNVRIERWWGNGLRAVIMRDQEKAA